jgi:hypothetical protein
MLVSSDPSPMAYILSNNIADNSCMGQLLFKFDPLAFSTTPAWIKKTIGSDSKNCGHLGLECLEDHKNLCMYFQDKMTKG